MLQFGLLAQDVACVTRRRRSRRRRSGACRCQRRGGWGCNSRVGRWRRSRQLRAKPTATGGQAVLRVARIDRGMETRLRRGICCCLLVNRSRVYVRRASRGGRGARALDRWKRSHRGALALAPFDHHLVARADCTIWASEEQTGSTKHVWGVPNMHGEYQACMGSH